MNGLKRLTDEEDSFLRKGAKNLEGAKEFGADDLSASLFASLRSFASFALK